MSRRLFGLFVVFVMVLLLTGIAQAQIRDTNLSDDRLMRPNSPFPIGDDDEDDDEGDDGSDLGFGKRFAGTWIGTGSFDLDFDCDGVADAFPGIPALDLHTFGVGGSHLVTNPNNPNTIHATWVKTGPRQLTSIGIGAGSDANCADPDGDGVCNGFGPQVSIFSIKTVVDFDSDYQYATTSFGATVHPPTEDPLDPDALVTICTVGSHTMFRKVNVPE